MVIRITKIAMSEGKTTRRRATGPHDLLFKQFLTHPNSARDFRQLHLPADLLAICDLSTLKLGSGSFIAESLHPYFCDVLYSLKTSQGDAYILIEHQSTPDRYIGFRLLRYAVATMQRYLDDGSKTLLLVVPLLFYTGKRRPYPWSTHGLHAVNHRSQAERLYNSDFPLIDVTAIADNDIMRHRRMAALTLLHKHIYQDDLAEVLDKLAQLLLGGTRNRKHFINQLAQRLPHHKDKLMTIAQDLERIGELR